MKTGNGFDTFTRFIDIPKACGKIKLRAAIKRVILLKKKVAKRAMLVKHRSLSGFQELTMVEHA